MRFCCDVIDPLCEDYQAFVSSVYLAVVRHRQQTFCTGRIKKVKICVTEQKVLNRVLEELQSQSAQGKKKASNVLKKLHPKSEHSIKMKRKDFKKYKFSSSSKISKVTISYKF